MRRWAAGLLLLAAGFAGGATAQPEGASAEIADHIDDLRSADDYVRERARRALAALGSDALPAVLAVLEGDSPRLRREAATVLGEMGAAARGTLPLLRRLADDPDPHVRKAAEEAIRRVESAVAAPGAGPPESSPLDVGGLIADLGSPSPDVRRNAAAALATAGGDPGRILTALLQAVADPDARVREAAVQALAAHAAGAAKAQDALIGALADPTQAVRFAAHDGLVALGAEVTIPLIERLAVLHRERADPGGMRPWIGALLWEIGPSTARPALALLDRAEVDLRAAGAEAVGYSRATDLPVVERLATALSDRALVRREAVRSLGAFGRHAMPAVPSLLSLLDDPARVSRTESAEALGAILLDAVHESGKRPGMPLDVRRALEQGLDWLAAHQAPDGRWDADGFLSAGDSGADPGRGDPAYDLGLTGLALSAFLRNGSRGRVWDARDTYAASVSAGLRHLVTVQGRDGSFARRGGHHMYDHAAATTALAEAWEFTRNPLYREPAQKAVDWLLAQRNPGAGWRYERDGTNDTSSTAWCITAVRAAERAGLIVDPEAFAGARAWFDSMTEPELGGTGYQQRGGPPARTNEMLDRFPADRSESLTAAALHARAAMGDDLSAELAARGVERLMKVLPVWDEKAGSTDFYYWYHGTLALYHCGGSEWGTWRAAYRDAVLPHQVRGNGGLAGSWDPVGPWGPEGGRLWSTTSTLLCLQACGGSLRRMDAVHLDRPPLNRIVRALRRVADEPGETDARLVDACRRALAAVHR